MVAAQKILVVDDEVLVTLGCRRILAKAGYEVATACTGQEGLNRALEGSFDLAVIDLRLPDLDGMELVRALKTHRPEVTIVIITGYGSVRSAVEAIRLGASDYVEKPFTPRQITEVIDRALAGPGGEAPPAKEALPVRDVIGRALEAYEDKGEFKIEASLVREVLRLAGRDRHFGQRLLTEGSRVLSGFALTPPAKAAIVSGDIAWIEKTYGELSAQERDWLQRRLEAETW